MCRQAADLAQHTGEGKKEERRGGKKTEKCHEPINDAWDRVSDILCCSYDKAAGQQKDGGEDVVQAKNSIIRLNLLELEVLL